MAFDLLLELKTRLEAAFDPVRFPCPAGPGEAYPVNIFIGAPPRKRSQTGEDYPYIVIRAGSGSDTLQGCQITIQILFASYAEKNEAEGYQQVQNLINRTRRILAENRPISRYSMESNIDWKIVYPDTRDQSEHPYYKGLLTATWQTQAVEHAYATDELLSVYGAGHR
ncbi:MAG: hypothetical protein GY874_14335 [Desulfobacteraceae bacterium]|nr:hypothetical protein [Desulfobacteraceae bacterium]